MQAAHIIPEVFPDVLDDVADGATFYLNPDRKPKFEGHAFLKVKSNVKGACHGIRLRDGLLMSLMPDEPVRVVALVAEVSGEDW